MKSYFYTGLISLVSLNLAMGQIDFLESSAKYDVRHSLSIHTIGAGVSIYDFNGDGLDDLTLGSDRGALIGFYVNTGNGFQQIVSLVDNREQVKQINWVDYDNDGDPDLYVAANDGISRLYQNRGDLNMQDVTESSGLPLNVHYGYGACWGDYNRDGWLDLYYASKGIIGDPDAIRSYNRLFKNNADGSFSERTFEANASDDGKLPFCAAFFDYNNDMWPDIYIANDKLTFNTLLENTGHGGFLDVSEETGSNARMNAMCVNPGDFNRDGWMDVYVTNTPIGSQCLQNLGSVDKSSTISFTNVAEEIGIHFPGGNCWGSNFLDTDNDGDLDLYVTSSINAPKEVSSAFYENIEGSHFDAPLIQGLLADTTYGFTNAIGDLNNDGLIDIVVQNDPPHHFTIWENKTVSANNWIKFKMEGVLSNRDGVGARLEAYTNGKYQQQFTLCGSGFLGQNSSFKHFGLSSAAQLDSLIVTWPTGHVDRFYSLAANEVYNIKEGSSTDGQIDIAEGIRIVEEKITTSVAEYLSDQLEISIGPNPGWGDLRFDSKQIIDDIQIYDSAGQIQSQYSIGMSQFLLDVEHLDVGLYILIINLRDQGVKSYKYMKL